MHSLRGIGSPYLLNLVTEFQPDIPVLVDTTEWLGRFVVFFEPTSFDRKKSHGSPRNCWEKSGCFFLKIPRRWNPSVVWNLVNLSPVLTVGFGCSVFLRDINLKKIRVYIGVTIPYYSSYPDIVCFTHQESQPHRQISQTHEFSIVFPDSGFRIGFCASFTLPFCTWRTWDFTVSGCEIEPPSNDHNILRL